MGKTPVLAPTPDWLIQAAAAASEVAGRWRGVPPIFTRGKAREILHPDWSVSGAELPPGPQPLATTLTIGFEGTVAWYRRGKAGCH